MRRALGFWRRYRAFSILSSGLLVGLPLLVALSVLTGIGPHPDREKPTPVPAPTPAEAPTGRTTLQGLVPAEFEQQAAIIIGANELVVHFPRVLQDMVAATHKRVKVMALVGTDQQRDLVLQRLAERDLPANAVQFLYAPAREAWIRDFGPAFLRGADRKLVMVDATYLEPGREGAEMTPSVLARQFGLPMAKANLAVFGGNMLHNGAGLCITSNSIIAQNLGANHVANMLRDYYRVRQWVHLQALEGEPTAHVDMFATFIDAQTIVVGQYDPKVDPVNARILDDNAALLAQASAAPGRSPVRVVRIPMPPHDERGWRTYTNVVYANGTLLVPIYPDVCPDTDQQVLSLYRGLLPGWEVVGIDCSGLIKHRGALHCVTINIPDHVAH